MKNKNKYVALVEKNFELTDEVIQYFKSQNVDVINYLKNIGVITLSSSRDLNSENLNYISHIEKDKKFDTGHEEE